MTFTTKKLVGHRTLVQGTDGAGVSGQQVLDSRQWDELNGHGEFDKAAKAFDAAVDEFFAPITKAAEAAEAAAQKPGDDPATYVVVNEGVAATAGEQRVVALLSHDSTVLRLLEEGKHDRLVWVNDSLEVTAESTATPATTGPGNPVGDTEPGRVYTD